MEGERVLAGSVKVVSLLHGNCVWKQGAAHLICTDRRWRLAVRLSFQKADRYVWELKSGTKIIYKTKGVQRPTLLLNFPPGGETLRMTDFNVMEANRLVDTINLILEKKMPIEEKKPWQDAENVPQGSPLRAVQKPPQQPAATRIPLSPKQPFSSKTQGKYSDPSLNPSNSSARMNMKFLDRGVSKSAEKASPFRNNTSSFYSKSQGQENQRYGAFGVTRSVPRIKRPGLLPDPERYANAKRARNYDWGKKPTTPTKTELRGFSNLGNTCYMNAILQSLFHLPTFAADLLALFRKVKQNGTAYPDNALFRALGPLLYAQRSDSSQERKRLYLGGVKNAISASAKRFSGYQQHDAHEFLGQMLDQLKDETIHLNKVQGQQGSGQGQQGSGQGQQGSGQGQQGSEYDPARSPEGHDSSTEEVTPEGDTYDNPTIKNFEFCVLHTIRCLQCREVVQKEETFHDLSLDIPRKARCMGERTLQHALDQFFEDEKIEYTCEKCGSTDSHVQHKFTRLPRIMIMHLKRYSILQQGSFCGKSGGSTAIPRFITLQGHCTETTSPPFPPDLNHSYDSTQPGSETKRHSDKLSEILDRGEDTPSRRKLNFVGSFKQVPGHVQVDAGRNLDQEDFTAEAKLSRERPTSRWQHSSGEDTDGADRVQTLSEDIDMISDDEPSFIPPLRTQYEHKQAVAQLDGTMDPHDSEVASQGSLDEEDIKQLTEEEQLELAMSRSLGLPRPTRHTETHTHTDTETHTSTQTEYLEQSPPLRYPSDDEHLPDIATEKFDSNRGQSKPAARQRRASTDSEPEVITNRHQELEPGEIRTTPVRRCSTDSEPDITFKHADTDHYSDDVSDTPGETRDSKRMGPGPRPMFPVFRNRLTPARRKPARVMHSTPNPEPELETGVKEERRSPTGKVEPMGVDDFDAVMTEEAKLELEKELFGDDTPEPPKPLTNEELKQPDGELFASPVKTGQAIDKENLSPVRADTKESEWAEKRREEKEKEDREFQEALERSIREQEDTDREKEELRRATELSLQDYNKDILPVLDSDEEVCGTEGPGLYSPGQLKELSANFRSGELPYSYRLVSVVSHLGSSSNVGHYVCDALDIRKNKWSSYDDSHVSHTTEINVCTSRQQTGYVFFYCAKELIEELEELYQNGLDGRLT